MPQQISHSLPAQPAPDCLLDESEVVAALTVSSRGTVVSANRALKNLLGLRSDGELVGRRLMDITADAQAASHWKAALHDGARRGVDIRLRGRDGRVVFLRGDIVCIKTSGGEASLRGVFVDAGGERQSRQVLQRSARLEALASLTGGVAHDFNNLLTVLVGNLSLAAEELRNRPETFAKLKASRDAAKRGSDLIRQLLGFARNESLETGVVDPTKIVANLLPLLSRALGSRVKLDTELSAESATVRANVAQLESVIVNLAVNAKDAIESAGKVTISVTGMQLSPEQGSAHKLPPGSYVRIAVSDNGKGIPPDVLQRVFEPFFTTKADRGGTGLGLSMVRGFASQCGGTALIESQVGKGTCVSLLLPRCTEHLDETSVKTMPLSVLPTGNERVVVLSEDEGLRSTVRQILETLGYKVQLCSATDELLLALGGERCDLLISDGSILEAANAKVAKLPRIVLSSGAQPSSPASAGEDAESVLLKPFSLADLAESVRKTLDGGG